MGGNHSNQVPKDEKQNEAKFVHKQLLYDMKSENNQESMTTNTIIRPWNTNSHI